MLFAHSVEEKLTNWPHRTSVMLWRECELTLLNELEAISDIALVSHEEQAAILGRVTLVLGGFFRGDLRSELNAVADDTTAFQKRSVVVVASRKCFAGVRCEGTSFLR
jgi:hypothetical protein